MIAIIHLLISINMAVGVILIDINKSFIDINKDGVGHITKRMLPTDAKELVHLTCNRVKVYIYHAKIFI